MVKEQVDESGVCFASQCFAINTKHHGALLHTGCEERRIGLAKLVKVMLIHNTNVLFREVKVRGTADS